MTTIPKHPFKVGDRIVAIKNNTGVYERGDVFVVKSISVDESYNPGQYIAWVGFVCDYPDLRDVASGKSTNWLASSFKLVNDRTCREPKNKPYVR